METQLEFDTSRYRGLARLIRHCGILTEGRPMPRAADFRASDVRDVVGWIYLIDVIDRGTDFRFRLFGSVCQAVYGFDLTGKALSDIEACGQLHGLRLHYRYVVENRKPLFRAARVVWANNKQLPFGRLLVPLMDDSEEVCRILAACDCGMTAEDAIMMRGLGAPHIILDDAAPLSREGLAAAV